MKTFKIGNVEYAYDETSQLGSGGSAVVYRLMRRIPQSQQYEETSYVIKISKHKYRNPPNENNQQLKAYKKEAAFFQQYYHYPWKEPSTGAIQVDNKYHLYFVQPDLGINLNQWLVKKLVERYELLLIKKFDEQQNQIQENNKLYFYIKNKKAYCAKKTENNTITEVKLIEEDVSLNELEDLIENKKPLVLKYLLNNGHIPNPISFREGVNLAAEFVYSTFLFDHNTRRTGGLIAHRDIKPLNILLKEKTLSFDSPKFYKSHKHTPDVSIVDFGLAENITEELQDVAIARGTPHYTPPETIQLVNEQVEGGKIGPKSGVYQLAPVIGLLFGETEEKILSAKNKHWGASLSSPQDILNITKEPYIFEGILPEGFIDKNIYPAEDIKKYAEDFLNLMQKPDYTERTDGMKTLRFFNSLRLLVATCDEIKQLKTIISENKYDEKLKILCVKEYKERDKLTNKINLIEKQEEETKKTLSTLSDNPTGLKDTVIGQTQKKQIIILARERINKLTTDKQELIEQRNILLIKIEEGRKKIEENEEITHHQEEIENKKSLEIKRLEIDKIVLLEKMKLLSEDQWTVDKFYGYENFDFNSVEDPKKVTDAELRQKKLILDNFDQYFISFYPNAESTEIQALNNKIKNALDVFYAILNKECENKDLVFSVNRFLDSLRSDEKNRPKLKQINLFLDILGKDNVIKMGLFSNAPWIQGFYSYEHFDFNSLEDLKEVTDATLRQEKLIRENFNQYFINNYPDSELIQLNKKVETVQDELYAAFTNAPANLEIKELINNFLLTLREKKQAPTLTKMNLFFEIIELRKKLLEAGFSKENSEDYNNQRYLIICLEELLFSKNLAEMAAYLSENKAIFQNNAPEIPNWKKITDNCRLESLKYSVSQCQDSFFYKTDKDKEVAKNFTTFKEAEDYAKENPTSEIASQLKRI